MPTFDEYLNKQLTPTYVFIAFGFACVGLGLIAAVVSRIHYMKTVKKCEE